jgi:hypothetical protein
LSGNNPVKYTGPDGRELRIVFYVTNIIQNEFGGKTARGIMSVYNTDTKNTLWIGNVVSGGIGNTALRAGSEHASFGIYDILQNTRKDGRLFHRLEALDSNYGDDIIDFDGQNRNSEVRLHYTGRGLTWGCIAIPDEYEEKVLSEMSNTTTGTVVVNTKYEEAMARFLLPKERQIRYGELKVVDFTEMGKGIELNQ